MSTEILLAPICVGLGPITQEKPHSNLNRGNVYRDDPFRDLIEATVTERGTMQKTYRRRAHFRGGALGVKWPRHAGRHGGEVRTPVISR